MYPSLPNQSFKLVFVCLPHFKCQVIETHDTHLGYCRGDTVFNTLVYGVTQPLVAPLLHEGQEGLFKHGRGAEHHHGQAVIWVSQAQSGRQHMVIPANL